MRLLLPRYVTTTVNVGRAMIQVAASGYSTHMHADALGRLEIQVCLHRLQDDISYLGVGLHFGL